MSSTIRVVVVAISVTWAAVAYFEPFSGGTKPQPQPKPEPVQPEPSDVVTGDYRALLVAENQKRAANTAAAIEGAIAEVNAGRFTHSSQVFDYVRKRDEQGYKDRSTALSQWAASKLGLDKLNQGTVSILKEMAQAERSDAN